MKRYEMPQMQVTRFETAEDTMLEVEDVFSSINEFEEDVEEW